MTTLLNRTEQLDTAQIDKIKRRNRVLTISVGVLTAALIALGAWIIFDDGSADQPDVAAELDQLFEDYVEAFNAYDADALQALITDDYVLYKPPGWDPQHNTSSPFTQEVDADVMLSYYMASRYPNMEIQWERIGEPITTGEGPWLISQVLRADAPKDPYPRGVEGITTLTVVDEDGTLKVSRENMLLFGLK